jgi:uncharacterized protein with HEPN domain
VSKSDPLRLADYLGHTLEAIERIQSYVAGLDEVAFLVDAKTQDAVVRNFEILGEAARNIEHYHRAYADAHPEAEWASMIALRNRVAHGYFTVDYELLWKTIHENLPEVHRTIRALLDGLAAS